MISLLFLLMFLFLRMFFPDSLPHFYQDEHGNLVDACGNDISY